MRIFIHFILFLNFRAFVVVVFFSSSPIDWNRYVEFIECESQFHFRATKKGFVLSIDRCSSIFYFLSTRETCGSFHHRLIKSGLIFPHLVAPFFFAHFLSIFFSSLLHQLIDMRKESSCSWNHLPLEFVWKMSQLVNIQIIALPFELFHEWSNGKGADSFSCQFHRKCNSGKAKKKRTRTNCFNTPEAWIFEGCTRFDYDDGMSSWVYAESWRRLQIGHGLNIIFNVFVARSVPKAITRFNQ